MTAPVLDRRDRRARRAGRQSTALFIATAILVVVALGCAGAALVVRHDTDELHARAEPVHQEVRALAAAEADAEQRLQVLRERARAATQALSALFAAELAQVDASNHAVDVANQTVDQYNNAQMSDLPGAFQAAGDAPVTDLEQKSQAVRAAAEAAQRAIAELRGAEDG
jgi:hypothetical protein